jgi:hypothetical protein
LKGISLKYCLKNGVDKDMNLDSVINFGIISSSLVLLGMSYGFLPGSYLVAFI